MFTYLSFRKTYGISPQIQIFILISLYIFTLLFGYREFQQFGTFWLWPNQNQFWSIPFVPLYEEFLFRGVILFSLLKYYSPIKSIIYSSLLFGIWHLKNIFFLDIEYVLYQMVYTGFFLGIAFGYISYKFKNIWPAVILHYLNNILATFIALYLPFF